MLQETVVVLFAIFKVVGVTFQEVMAGAMLSIIQLKEAGVRSVPKALTARTLKVWLPEDKEAYCLVDVQVLVAAPSNWHWKLVGELVPVKVNAIDVEAVVVVLGLVAVIKVSGRTPNVYT